MTSPQTSQKGEFKRYFINTAWMLSEKVFSLGLGLIASVLLARSLGPADYGFFNYAISLVAFLGVFCHLGLDGLAVKKFKDEPNRTSQTVTTILTMKLIIATLGFFTLAIIASHTATRPEHTITITIIGLSLFAKPFETLNHWFQAHVMAKLGSISHLAGQATGNGLKIAVAVTGLPLVYAAGAHATILALTALLLTILFIRQNRHQIALTFSWTKAKELLQNGAWVFFGSVTAVVYLKMDQLMLQHMVGETAVGHYAAAAKLSEAWYFVPMTLMSSLFPKLLEKKDRPKIEYHEFLQTLLDALFILAAGLSIFVLFFSEQIISILYGEEYAISSKVLSIHIFASIFIFMRALFSKWILAEELFKLSLLTQGMGATSNIILNYFFIHSAGVIGAAWATLISYAIASYFSLLIHPKSRIIFYFMTKTIMSHWALTIKKILTQNTVTKSAN